MDNLDESMNSVRHMFPGATRQVYLDVSSRGLIPLTAKESLDRYLDDRIHGTSDKAQMFSTVERVRDKFARLINAEPDEVAFMKNISDGICTVATAFDWQRGQTVLLCRDVEHPNNVYPWLNLAERVGIRVRSVPAVDGHVPVDALIDAIDDSTRVVSVSSVSFVPGFRTDLAELGTACRERGVFLLVDGAQSVGVLDSDVERLKIDGLVTATQKGLLGLYGMGFLYVRRDWADRMRPMALARFGVDLGHAHEASIGTDGIRLMAGARRFEIGNYNYPAAAALEPCLDLILSRGQGAIETHACRLARNLAEGLVELGLPVAGGDHAPHRSHIVCVGSHGGSHEGTDDPDTSALHQALVAAGVKHALRGGMIRLSAHLYNDNEDIARTVAAAREWVFA
ncbi:MULTISPECIES: aminotransferase class V-fold PLP-dependent enzyme [unclassified Aurantimonas]|uniref:aminotransferase class V-fold PLP-dependent enzyme n=1 Tax=unclassified Aurantimonas TaxID=2638230 RepID=UPI002E18748C|nr:MULTISPECIES: aminotransferase class V-fold PLP-dependent enzyme [unclassified Aurantimonas]MEC5292795.1 aminotransferase class V-fold PLP-dependent enzyme [Aurantimonas sp. C2-3-R2]MEC5413847.1 aminotransferase class V-fold PLP-dependent enzyme [Aurantimonas sp. C2-4-R8]